MLNHHHRPCGRWLDINIQDFGCRRKKCSIELGDLEGVVCMSDDILVCGRDQAEHDSNDSHVSAVLHRINDAGFTVNKAKCES